MIIFDEKLILKNKKKHNLNLSLNNIKILVLAQENIIFSVDCK